MGDCLRFCPTAPTATARYWAMPDHTFLCKCHGSQFDPQGHVLHGPAVRALPQFPTSVNEAGNLIVQVTRLHFDEE